MNDGVCLREGAGTFHHDAQNDPRTHISCHPLHTGYKAAEEEPGSNFRVPKEKAAGVSEMS